MKTHTTHTSSKMLMKTEAFENGDAFFVRFSVDYKRLKTASKSTASPFTLSYEKLLFRKS